MALSHICRRLPSLSSTSLPSSSVLPSLYHNNSMLISSCATSSFISSSSSSLSNSISTTILCSSSRSYSSSASPLGFTLHSTGPSPLPSSSSSSSSLLSPSIGGPRYQTNVGLPSSSSHSLPDSNWLQNSSVPNPAGGATIHGGPHPRTFGRRRRQFKTVHGAPIRPAVRVPPSLGTPTSKHHVITETAALYHRARGRSDVIMMPLDNTQQQKLQKGKITSSTSTSTTSSPSSSSNVSKKKKKKKSATAILEHQLHNPITMNDISSSSISISTSSSVSSSLSSSPIPTTASGPSVPPPSPEQIVLLERQLKDEILQRESAVERFENQVSSLRRMGRGSNMKPALKLVMHWYEDLVKLIHREQEEIHQQAEETKAKRPPRQLNQLGRKRWSARRQYGSSLVKLPASSLAAITLTELLNQLMRGRRAGDCAAPFVDTVVAIGKAIEAEIILWSDRQNEEKWDQHLKQAHRDAEKKGTAPQLRQRNVLSSSTHQWDNALRAHVGDACLQLLLPVARLSISGEWVHVLKSAYKPAPGSNSLLKTEGVINCDPRVYALLMKDDQIWETIEPRFKPMLIPPRPWGSYNEGGYVTLQAPLVRTREGVSEQLESVRIAEMPQIYESLDLVSSVPWRINDRVLKIMDEVYGKEGGGVASLPHLRDRDIPPYPAFKPDGKKLGKQEWLERNKAVREARNAIKTNRERVSMRADFKYKLDLAKELSSNQGPCYFPCNIDFRGRAYPVPPHLSHVSSDISRGLLLFWKGIPLGENGVRWLKIHLANTFGKNNLSLDNRVLWADENMTNIRASGTDPLGKRNKRGRWWLENAEDHWQALAVCMEIVAAQDYTGGEENYVCHLPVQMDGSCNGLQHYAALGRDARGGRAVNLTPPQGTNPGPADVYTDVLEAVKSHVGRDAAKHQGDSSSSVPVNTRLARMVNGKLTRKIVKQTVMTSVYGVTLIGARDQIEARLSETDIKWPEEQDGKTGEQWRSDAAGYLAKVTLDSIGEVFTVGKQIMTWLKMCSLQLSLRGYPTSWVTPMGLPVVQPYRKATVNTIRVLGQSISLSQVTDLNPLDPDRQKDALPPNFVHSLDATHMMMTARYCASKGITFASVHDSFWTHAGHVDSMGEGIRQQFFDLYTRSPDPLEQLYDQLCMRFPEVKFPSPPRRGQLDLRAVTRSPYFFS